MVWRPRGAPARMPAPRWEGSEGVLGADLQAAGVADDAARPSKRQAGLTPRIKAAEVLVVERVEEIECDRQRRSGDAREVFAQPEVDVAVGEGVRNDEANALRCEPSPL